MVGGGRIVDPVDDPHAAGIRHQRIRNGGFVFADLYIAAGGAEIDIELSARCIIRSEGKAQEALFTARGDLGRYVEEGGAAGLSRRSLIDLHQAPFLKNEEVA